MNHVECTGESCPICASGKESKIKQLQASYTFIQKCIKSEEALVTTIQKMPGFSEVVKVGQEKVQEGKDELAKIEAQLAALGAIPAPDVKIEIRLRGHKNETS